MIMFRVTVPTAWPRTLCNRIRRHQCERLTRGVLEPLRQFLLLCRLAGCNTGTKPGEHLFGLAKGELENNMDEFPGSWAPAR